MLSLALVMVLSADGADAGCPWKDPKKPPMIEATVFGGVEMTYENDSSWFRCAKRAGGTLELVWSVGQAGELAPRAPVKLTTYSGRESVRELCATPGLKQIQATIKGVGEMQKLDWSSNVVEVYCPKCQWSGDDNSLALFTKGLTPAGQWTIDAKFDPRWYACAKPGSALELHLYTGATRAEVLKATEPSHVVKGLDGPKVKKAFSSAPMCKTKPAFVAVEFGGTGEFRVLSRGRATYESPCK